ncbi:MAG: amino acid adenylation domain-containing protein, partial [Ktedonobacterales bacterium]|nr:amino acid adenylation domain-containing protein [Ktedonobacterales bacterium]
LVERDASHAPLVQVLFTFQTAQRRSAVQAVELDWDMPIAKFDLTLDVGANGAEWAASLEYNTDLFAPATIARMSAHFLRLLGGLLDAPEQPVSVPTLLSAAERQQVVVGWNSTTVPVPDATMPELVEQQAARTPTATALIAIEATLTYAELNGQANQLAYHLHGLGVGPGQIVGVCLNRTPDLVIAILAILKTGAAYLPLDPTYPTDRLEFSLADAQSKLLLTSSDLRHVLAESPLQRLELDGLHEHLRGLPAENLGLAHDPTVLAYIIYTSGSTGRPKGVAIAHQSAVAFLAWVHTVYTPADLSGVLASTSVCFDISIFEMFAPLSIGGTIIMAENALALPTLPARDLVTLVDTVPSAISELELIGGIPPTAQVLNIAGEQLARTLVDRLYRLPTVRQIYNLYGPTEDTTFSTLAAVPRDTAAAPTIGRPIANTQLYILDARRQPVPVGVPGEIYLGGMGLTMGYLGRPDMTAERYVPNPFAADPAARMYRTGDLGRFFPDGEVEYLGRMDQQVKVRGFRIELGEIETVLSQVPGVEDTVVAVRADADNNKQIVAYVVADAAVSTDALRDALRARVPGYMVPAAFVRLDALPRTPNGKVNRRGLPDPTWGDAAGYVAPRTPTEAQLAALWADVLHLEQVGVTDNFFDLGGHSLLATRLLARLRATLAPDFTLRALFAAPTVAQLALAIGEGAAGAVPAPALPRVARTAPLVLSSGQERLWFFDQLVPGNILYNVPFALRLAFTVDDAVLAATLHAMMLRHESWRTTFHATEVGPRQRIAPTQPEPLRFVDLRAVPPAERDQAIQLEAQREAQTSFDLAHGPLVRVAALHLEAATVLIVTQHHIITDGASLELLLDELLLTYSALAAGTTPSLPAVERDYVDYAAWQRDWLGSAASQEHLTLWRGQLADYPDILDLPTDYIRPVVQSYAGATLPFALDAAVVARIQDTSRAAGVTPY